MIFGWDISTSIIGMSVFTDGCEYVSSQHLDLRKIDTDIIQKSYNAQSWVENIVEKHASEGKTSFHFVEDKLSSFTGGKTMQQTLLKLAAFNATVSYIVWRAFDGQHEGCKIYHVHPSTVKAIMKKDGLIIPHGSDKKELTLKFVSSKEKTFVVDLNKNGNPQPWCYDRADSYCIARAGFLKGYLSCDATREENIRT